MLSMNSRRAVLVSSLVATFVAVAATTSMSGQSPTSGPSYSPTATVPIGLQGYSDLDIDPATGRAYLAIRDGMRVLDTKTGRIGPELRELETSGAIELAPDINRIFAEIDDDYVGFIDLTSLRLDRIAPVESPGTLMYEPATEELFVFSSREPDVRIFDGRTGDEKRSITLPGWSGLAVLHTPGRIFVTVPPKSGLYVIDTVEKQISEFPMPRGVDLLHNRFTLVGDAQGRTLFAADDGEIIAFDGTTGERLASVKAFVSSLMYDDATGVLLARVSEADWGRKQVVYRLADHELERLGSQNLDFDAGSYLHATTDGFVTGFVTTTADPSGRGLPPVSRKYVTVWQRAGSTR